MRPRTGLKLTSSHREQPMTSLLQLHRRNPPNAAFSKHLDCLFRSSRIVVLDTSDFVELESGIKQLRQL